MELQYLNISKEILYDSELDGDETILLAIISLFDSEEDGCYAHNAYLQTPKGWKEGKIKRILANLIKMGCITRELTPNEKDKGGTQRTLRVNREKYPRREIPIKKTPNDDSNAEYTLEFEEFFTHYPNKKCKRGAFKSWKARLAEGVLSNTMINAAKILKDECDYGYTEEAYVEYPQKFLNANRPFEDHLIPLGKR